MNLIQHETKYGPVWISADIHNESDLSVVREIFTDDAYRVQKLHAEGFSPNIIFDCGCNHGLFSFICGKLWPGVPIICFEPQLAYLRQAILNLPDSAIPICLPVMGTVAIEAEMHSDQRQWHEQGRFINGREVARLASMTPRSRLLKIDTEGSETNLISELFGIDALDMFDVLTGEWHREPAKEAIKRYLPLTHDLTIKERGECDTFFATRKTTT